MLADLHFDDRDEALEFHRETVGADFDLVKFDRGDIHLGMTWIQLPDLLIVWARAKGNARWMAQHTNALPCFFFAYETEHRFWGRDLPPAHAVFGRAHDVRDGGFANGCTTLDVTVSEEMCDRLGWTVGPDRILETDPNTLYDLRRICRMATARSRQLNTVDGIAWPAGEVDRWQGLILDALERAAGPWLDEDGPWIDPVSTYPRYHRLVIDAEAFLREQIASGPLAVAELASSLGVPERTLYHAFRRSLCISPRRYLELLRLQTFRQRLKAARGTNARVLDIAHDLGYSEFGRLAGLYKDQFGELPSDTVRSPRPGSPRWKQTSNGQATWPRETLEASSEPGE